MIEANDRQAESCKKCQHVRKVHGGGEKPCQAYTCKRDKKCGGFVGGKVRMPRQNEHVKPAKDWKRGQPRDILTPVELRKLSVKAGVRIRPVKCGKPKCNRPHFIYAYQRIYTGGQCKERYLGRCPAKH